MIIKKNLNNQKTHIIGIGINRYASLRIPNLENCVDDVERFIQYACTNFKSFDYDSECITELYDYDARGESIEHTIKEKLERLNFDDNLIFYFAGHGFDHNKKSYLIPYDAKHDYINPEKSALISFSTLFEWLDNKKPLHIVIILDCYFGGRIINTKHTITSVGAVDKSQKTDYDYMRNSRSAWVITSGSDAQNVDDGIEGKGSPFSNVLLNLTLLN